MGVHVLQCSEMCFFPVVSPILNAYLIQTHPHRRFFSPYHTFSLPFDFFSSSSASRIAHLVASFSKFLPFVSFSACIPIKLLRKNGSNSGKIGETNI